MESTATAQKTQTASRPTLELLDNPLDYYGFDLSWHQSLPGIVDRLVEFTGFCTSRNAPSRALVLAGHPGCGKTHLLNLVHWYSRIGSTIINEVDLFNRLKKAYSRKDDADKILRPYRHAELLAYDDLGAGRGNEEWRDDIYYQLFDTGQAFLITTNLSGDAFEQRIGKRVASRLKGAMGGDLGTYFVEMWDVGDYRASARPEMRR